MVTLVTLLGERHLKFFVHKKRDPHSYISITHELLETEVGWAYPWFIMDNRVMYLEAVSGHWTRQFHDYLKIVDQFWAWEDTSWHPYIMYLLSLSMTDQQDAWHWHMLWISFGRGKILRDILISCIYSLCQWLTSKMPDTDTCFEIWAVACSASDREGSNFE